MSQRDSLLSLQQVRAETRGASSASVMPAAIAALKAELDKSKNP
jgi:hypothetical protein